MIKKAKALFNGISVRILLSYLSILFIPLIAVFFIYAISTQALLDYQKSQTQFNLEKTAATVQLRFEELNNINSYIQSNPGVNSIINSSKNSQGKRDIYLIRNALSNIPTYRLTNQLIKQIYIFFIEAEFVGIPPHGYGLTEQTFLSNIAFHGLSYEGFLTLTQGNHASTLMLTEDSKGKDLLLLRNITGSPSLIAIQIDLKALQDLLRTNDTGPNGATYILNDTGQLLTGIGNSGFSLEQLNKIAGEANFEYTEVKNKGRSYLTYVYPQGGLTYISLVEKNYLLQKINSIKYLIFALSLAAFTIGLLLCISLWKKRKTVVTQVTSTAKRLGVFDETAFKTEGRLLQTTVSSLADEVGSLRETLDQQQNILSYTVLRNLLHGTFSTHSDIESEVQSAGLTFDSAYFYVVNIIFSRPESLGDQLLPYRLFLKQFLQETLQKEFLVCDMDNTSFVLLLFEDSKRPLGEYKALFMALSQQIEQASWIAPTFAISSFGDTLLDLQDLYNQTNMVGEYLTCLNRHGVYHIDEIPQKGDVFSFPIEREMQFLKILRSRPEEELVSFWRQLMDENLKKKILSVEMLISLRERIRHIILHALTEWVGEENIDSLIQAVKKAKSFDGLYQWAKEVQRALALVAGGQNSQKHLKTKALLHQAIEQNYQDSAFTLTALAELTGIAENTLYRNFKTYFGTSFSSFLEQYRIEKAFDLLRNSVPIKDVAQQVGYTSDHSFRRAFKRIMKIPPSQFFENQ